MSPSFTKPYASPKFSGFVWEPTRPPGPIVIGESSAPESTARQLGFNWSEFVTFDLATTYDSLPEGAYIWFSQVVYTKQNKSGFLFVIWSKQILL